MGNSRSYQRPELLIKSYNITKPWNKNEELPTREEVFNYSRSKLRKLHVLKVLLTELWPWLVEDELEAGETKEQIITDKIQEMIDYYPEDRCPCFFCDYQVSSVDFVIIKLIDNGSNNLWNFVPACNNGCRSETGGIAVTLNINTEGDLFFDYHNNYRKFRSLLMREIREQFDKMVKDSSDMFLRIIEAK